MVNFAFDVVRDGYCLNRSGDKIELFNPLERLGAQEHPLPESIFYYIIKDLDIPESALDTALWRGDLPLWFEKNSIDINLMTLDDAIDSEENFVYSLCFDDPWNISKFLENIRVDLVFCINTGKCNFIINDAMEGRLWDKKDIKVFLDSLISKGINPSRIIVLTASWSYLYNNMPFRMVYWPWIECIISEKAEPISLPRHKSAKKFLCLNLYNKQDRFYFIYQMYKNNILDQFNFSHNKVTSKDDFDVWDEWVGTWPQCLHVKWTDDMSEFAKTTPYVYDLAPNPHGPNGPMYDHSFEDRNEVDYEQTGIEVVSDVMASSGCGYDIHAYAAVYTNITKHRDVFWGPDSSRRRWEFTEVVPQHRQDNYIYIVTESVFNTERPYLQSSSQRDPFDGMTRDTSEKTWKPFALKMPFILSHQPFALKRLRDIGYKTFHTIWDESYDEIVDCNRRMAAIIDLVVSLNSREDFVDMIKSCDDIVEHNFKMLKLRSPEQDMIREVSRFENK